MNLICCGGKVKICVVEVVDEGWEVLVLVDPVFLFVDEVKEFLVKEHGFKEVEVEKGFGRDHLVFSKRVVDDVREYAVGLWVEIAKRVREKDLGEKLFSPFGCVKGSEGGGEVPLM
jgi:hypothetical protein